MPRQQPTLHEAMRRILSEVPDRTAPLELLRAENERLDLYRQDDGDGPHPEAGQFRIRAINYPKLFELVPPDRVALIE